LQITFVTGLLVIIPIAVPVWVFWELIAFVDRLLDPFVGGTFPFHLPGLGLFVAVLVVLLMGIVATNVVVMAIWGGWTASCTVSRSFAVSFRGETAAERLFAGQSGRLQGIRAAPKS
jgi:hypothetical protein